MGGWWARQGLNL